LESPSLTPSQEPREKKIQKKVWGLRVRHHPQKRKGSVSRRRPQGKEGTGWWGKRGGVAKGLSMTKITPPRRRINPGQTEKGIGKNASIFSPFGEQRNKRRAVPKKIKKSKKKKKQKCEKRGKKHMVY